MILVIDNYDSFTFNLVQYFGELGAETLVKRNDEISVAEVMAMQPQKIIISPGPCTPTEAGISVELVQTAGKKIPLLGVCLGHQSIGQAFGGRVVKAPEIMHGKVSAIYHENKGVFKNLPNPFEATRYHSLIIEKHTLPADLEITASTDSGLIMGVQHKHFPIHGVQFHPESILTKFGKQLLQNFLDL